MCDHISVECHIGISPGEMVIHIKCRDCGSPPLMEAMDILAMEALVQHAQQKMLVDDLADQCRGNAKLN